jgi:hypothetical protein
LKGLCRLSEEVIELQVIKGVQGQDDIVERDEYMDVPGVWSVHVSRSSAITVVGRASAVLEGNSL